MNSVLTFVLDIYHRNYAIYTTEHVSDPRNSHPTGPRRGSETQEKIETNTP